MKLAVAFVAAASASEKKVPPRHPLQRLNKLNMFAVEWVNDNLSEKMAANWSGKFDRNVDRLEKRWDICGFYDENSEHGGPRARREDEEFERYDKTNPVRGIQQITNGFRKWAQRYIADCKVQPAKQVERSAKWFGQLTEKLAEHNGIEE